MYRVGRTASAVTVASTAFLVAIACATPGVKSTSAHPPSREQLAELWIDPGTTPRDLASGVGAGHVRPELDGRYTVLDRDTRGFSITYRVRDRRGAEWNVKIGPEAQPEVVASRIVWGVGFHQVPSFFVERWTAVDGARTQTLGGARFRPRDLPLDGKGTWSWQRNPFVGTREYNGLLSVLMLINSTDLKNDNNELYEVKGTPRERARHWYVVKDLGASFGETGRVDPRRGYIDGFEKEPFVLEPQGPFARFAFRGRHQELLQRIPITDLQWACHRVLALTDRQLRDAFAAGNYDETTTSRYITRLRAKAEEGLALR